MIDAYLTVFSDAICPHGLKQCVGCSLSTYKLNSQPIFNFTKGLTCKKKHQCKSPWILEGDFILTLCMLGIFSFFCCDLLTFLKMNFFQKILKNTIRVSNGLDPDQNCSGGPDLDPNCLQSQMTKVSTIKERVKLF